jgi:MFS family permease
MAETNASSGGCIMVVGAILQTAAVNYAMMLVARVITGVGNGLLTSTVPSYQSECAKPHRRGQLVLFEGSLITFGIMISYWLDLGFYFTSGSISWRFPIAFQILFAVMMIVCMVRAVPFLPPLEAASPIDEPAVCLSPA